MDLREPLLLCDRRARLITKHDVHLLEGAALGLRDQPIDSPSVPVDHKNRELLGHVQCEGGHTTDVDGPEHQEDLVSEVGHGRRRDLRQHEVYKHEIV